MTDISITIAVSDDTETSANLVTLTAEGTTVVVKRGLGEADAGSLAKGLAQLLNCTYVRHPAAS